MGFAFRENSRTKEKDSSLKVGGFNQRNNGTRIKETK